MTRNVLQCAVLALLISIFGRAAAVNVSDSLSDLLATAKTPADSIPILYNIFDCSTGKSQYETLETLYQVANRVGDEATILDVIRQGANLNATSDSLLDVLVSRAETLGDSDNKRATILFVNARINTRQIRALPEVTRDKRLREYLSRYKEMDQLDDYQRIEYLFNLCAYLRLATDGDLLINYLSELQKLIDRLPTRELFLRSLFYTQAAVSYLDNGMPVQAVAVNKTLLNIIDELEKQYKSSGRIYRNYNRSKYICYRRLLKCHSALTPDEIDIYYDKLLSLIDSSGDVRLDFERRQRPRIYYLMAKKRYADAIPLITQQLDDKNNTREEHRYLIEAMIEAADAVGDKENLLKALKTNNTLLKERIEEKAAESYKELQIVYEVNELKQENDDLTMANRQITYNRHRELMTYSFVALAILLFLLIVVYIYFKRAHNLSRRLSKSNELLTNERDSLKRTQKELIIARDKAKAADRVKTDFVNNMSHEIRTPLAAISEYSNLISDFAEEDKREYIRRFADIVSLNTDLLLTLVNDVLELPAIENAKLSVHPSPTSAKEICTLSIDSMRKRLRPGVDLIFENANDDDVIINTDPHRVEQVLLNMLSNAAKFTEKGHIYLGYKLSDDGKTVSFTVTDTGIGVPRGKEEIIFSRFEKLNSESQGNGLGLYISRLLANLLKGSLKLDAEYRKGARFIFTIPVSE